MTQTVARMKALGDSNRFRISMVLLCKPLCVCQLLRILPISGGTMTSHLKILKNAGLVARHKDGKWVEYRIADEDARQFLQFIRESVKKDNQLITDWLTVKDLDRQICSV